MDILTYEDRLELLGVLAGGFIVLVALGTLAGTPWTTAKSGVVAGLQLLGIALALGIGVLLIAVTSTSERFGVLSGT
ncbi:hypothetical protein [Halovenus marina]|uniref:hypothetical protein n=1 Tax=Halovenus marina TaxID=3396621 RepID=UPI003F577E76